VATKTKVDIQNKKFMFAIPWNPDRFHVIDRFPTGAKINSTYDATKIVQPLHEAFFPQGRNPHGKRPVVYVNNRLVHRSVAIDLFMKTRDMVSMPHPPHSANLAPTGFCLFPTVKERLKHAGVTDEDQ
jgi:hypothetical protein